MNTYFYVQAIGPAELVAQLGPYFSFENAAEVLEEHLQDFVIDYFLFGQIAEFTKVDGKEILINIKVIRKNN